MYRRCSHSRRTVTRRPDDEQASPDDEMVVPDQQPQPEQPQPEQQPEQPSPGSVMMSFLGPQGHTIPVCGQRPHPEIPLREPWLSGTTRQRRLCRLHQDLSRRFPCCCVSLAETQAVLKRANNRGDSFVGPSTRTTSYIPARRWCSIPAYQAVPRPATAASTGILLSWKNTQPAAVPRLLASVLMQPPACPSTVQGCCGPQPSPTGTTPSLSPTTPAGRSLNGISATSSWTPRPSSGLLVGRPVAADFQWSPDMVLHRSIIFLGLWSSAFERPCLTLIVEPPFLAAAILCHDLLPQFSNPISPKGLFSRQHRLPLSSDARQGPHTPRQGCQGRTSAQEPAPGKSAPTPPADLDRAAHVQGLHTRPTHIPSSSRTRNAAAGWPRRGPWRGPTRPVPSRPARGVPSRPGPRCPPGAS